VETAGFPAYGELMPPESYNISGGNDTIDSVYVSVRVMLPFSAVVGS